MKESRTAWPSRDVPLVSSPCYPKVTLWTCGTRTQRCLPTNTMQGRNVRLSVSAVVLAKSRRARTSPPIRNRRALVARER